MYDNLARRAITAALSNDWATALQVNLLILEEEVNDIDALNRAARASVMLGEYEKAIQFSNAVISQDPLNTIAIKCLAKCSSLSENNHTRHSATTANSAMSDNFFLEEPGRTKIVSLINLCESSLLATLNSGDVVMMIPKMHKVMITTSDDAYIGRLPDDLATKIIYFCKHGNQYDAFIKSASQDDVKLFIKETVRAESLKHLPSFPVR